MLPWSIQLFFDICHFCCAYILPLLSFCILREFNYCILINYLSIRLSKKKPYWNKKKNDWLIMTWDSVDMDMPGLISAGHTLVSHVWSVERILLVWAIFTMCLGLSYKLATEGCKHHNARTHLCSIRPDSSGRPWLSSQGEGSPSYSNTFEASA